METGTKKRSECRYTQRQCCKPVVEGYQLCTTHILEDKDSPFQQCSYVSSKTGRRCVQAAPNAQSNDSECLQHAAKQSRARCTAAKKQQTSNAFTAKSLLHNLREYRDTELALAEEPSVQHETMQSQLAELASSDDSDVEERSYPASSYMWQPDSDAESIDSEGEDMFKYAEVFTAEEVTRITREKLIRLQSLYIEQFKWLQNVLRERRREYLSSRASSDEHKDEDEVMSLQQQGSVKSKASVEEYKALKRYHRRHGKEALMYMKSQERRKAACNTSTEGHHHNRYRHASMHGTKYCSNRSVKCHEKSLPFTRYCLHHVEADRRQVLFRRCGYEAVPGGLCCERIVVDVTDHAHCPYHTNLGGANSPELEESSSSETELVNTERADCSTLQMADCTSVQMNVSTTEQMNVSTDKQMYGSTTEQLDVSTDEHMDVSTAEQVDVSTAEQLDVSTNEQMDGSTTEPMADCVIEDVAGCEDIISSKAALNNLSPSIISKQEDTVTFIDLQTTDVLTSEALVNADEHKHTESNEQLITRDGL